MHKILIGLALLVIAGIVGILWLRSPPRPEIGTNIEIEALLRGQDQGFTHADAPWQYSFPDDHGAHPAYRLESWYFLGTLTTKQGRNFGFQLTFFRLGLTPEPVQRASAWATHQIYRGHFALTDVAQSRFLAFERFSRAALGLSGAKASPVRIWLEDWFVEGVNGGDENAIFYLRAGADDLRIDLDLRSAKPMVLGDGDNLPLPGGAFHAYLIPRLRAQGTLHLDDDTFQVEGLAWLDRAWGSLPLPQGQVALNRFVLQLDDGREILCFQLHRRDGGGRPINMGLVVRRDGSVLRLDRQDMAMDVLDDWVSPRERTRYPARWRLRIPAEAIELDITPYIADQEMNLSIRYWSGAVRITGKAGGRPVSGNGYVELTGYAQGVTGTTAGL